MQYAKWELNCQGQSDPRSLARWLQFCVCCSSIAILKTSFLFSFTEIYCAQIPQCFVCLSRAQLFRLKIFACVQLSLDPLHLFSWIPFQWKFVNSSQIGIQAMSFAVGQMILQFTLINFTYVQSCLLQVTPALGIMLSLKTTGRRKQAFHTCTKLIRTFRLWCSDWGDRSQSLPVLVAESQLIGSRGRHVEPPLCSQPVANI